MVADKMDSQLFSWDLPKLREENERRMKREKSEESITIKKW